MDNLILNKKANVLVVEPATTLRHMMVDVLRELGISIIRSVSTGKEALEILEVEALDWLILPLMASEPVNAFQLLRLATTYPALNGMRISLTIEETDEPCLPLAYELGLLSWHAKASSRGAFLQDMHQLFALLAHHDGNDTLVAASYLRSHLLSKGHHPSLLALEERLVLAFPNQAALLMHLGEAQILNALAIDGMRNLRKASLFDPNTAEQASKLNVSYSNKLKLSQAEYEAVNNIFDLASCIVIDPDSLVQNAIGQYLNLLGIPEIKIFNDGQSAWEWCQGNPIPSLIILEWKLPKLTGPIFLQRLHQKGSTDVPVLIASSLVKTTDMPILKELNVGAVVNKPFDQASFQRTLMWLLQQDRQPTDQRTLLLKIRRLLGANNLVEAKAMAAPYLANPKVNLGQKRMLESEIAFSEGSYERARSIGIEALKLAGDTLLLLNIIGKSSLRLGDAATALKFFEKAQAMSPLNIERLCNIATAQMETGAADESQRTLAAASQIDAGNPMITATKAQIALVAGDTVQASGLLDSLDSSLTVVSYMNSRAVALSRVGRFEESVTLYERTLASLTSTQHATAHAAVCYNLALTFVRQDKLAEALVPLQAVAATPGTPLARKAASLVRRIERSIKTKEPLMISAHAPLPPAVALHAEDFAPSQAREEAKLGAGPAASLRQAVPGQEGPPPFCCHLIFEAGEALGAPCKHLLATHPHFQRRDAIKRPKEKG